MFGIGFKYFDIHVLQLHDSGVGLLLGNSYPKHFVIHVTNMSPSYRSWFRKTRSNYFHHLLFVTADHPRTCRNWMVLHGSPKCNILILSGWVQTNLLSPVCDIKEANPWRVFRVYISLLILYIL